MERSSIFSQRRRQCESQAVLNTEKVTIFVETTSGVFVFVLCDKRHVYLVLLLGRRLMLSVHLERAWYGSSAKAVLVAV